MSLSGNKKADLSDKVCTDIGKIMVEHYRNLRRHEVSKMDAAGIVRQGVRKAANSIDLIDLKEEE